MKTTIEESNIASVTRLARQLNKDPQTFAAEILRAGIQAIDDATGGSCRFEINPLHFAACVTTHRIRHECTISGIIERMTPEELADAEKDAENIEETLQELIHDRYTRGVSMELLQ